MSGDIFTTLQFGLLLTTDDQVVFITLLASAFGHEIKLGALLLQYSG